MTPTSVASVQEIRAHFPALKRQHNGHDVAYFDGPGGTQVPRAVVASIGAYLFEHNANTHWNYPSSAETDDLLAEARQAFADFFNSAPHEVVFGANMTTLTLHLGRALAQSFHYGPGDEIVVTELDHHANVDPWRFLARERGAVVRTVKLNPATGQLDWDDLKRSLSKRTRLLAIGAASNALGTVSDVAQAAALAHEAGALVYVDAVHYAAHHLVDVRALGCDFLACSAYKFYGPHLGVLFARRELLQRLDFPKLVPASNEAPERAESGTQNHEGIVGAAAAVDFLASLAQGGQRRSRLGRVVTALHGRSAALVKKLWSGLDHIKGVRLFGPPPAAARTPTVSFVVDGCASGALSAQLAERGLFTSHGDFYAATVVERLGLAPEGLVRVGCACYTTPEEVERLLQGVRDIADRVQGPRSRG